MATPPKPAKLKRPRPDMITEIASSGDGRDITKPWVGDLEEPTDTKLRTAVDWGIYNKIRKDDQVKSCLEQRIRAVVSAEWDVIPGDDQDPVSVKAAEAFKANMAKIGWDRITKKMLYAPFHGYAVAEVIWPAQAVNGIWEIEAIKVKNARRFRFDNDRNLRLLTKTAPKGELLPDRKFWVVTEGGTDDDVLYGEGLADWLYWPTLFKRNGLRFWNLFLDKFGTPTAKATYRRGTPQKDIEKLTELLRALSTDSGIAVPEGIAVEFLQVARSGVGDFKELCRYMDEAIAKIILSQTMTTQDGSSLSQAQVHAGVKLEVVKADADLLSDSFNDSVARWWTDLNFGPDVACPLIVRLLDEEADLKLLAETDAVLDGIGWVRKEESFKDIFGDGYERKAVAAPLPVVPVGTEVPRAVEPAAPKPVALTEEPALQLAATDPRPLYVYRRLKNAAEVIRWAKTQGFLATLPASDMHVTITYSKRPVDWFKMGSGWNSGDPNGGLIVQPGGPRAVGKLGEKAVVLHFSSGDIEWRHEQMADDGASWDFPEFRPHITITYEGAEHLILDEIKPYQGKLVFGPEIFDPIVEDWQDRLSEVQLAEAEMAREDDIIDQVVADILEEQGWKPLSAQLKAVINVIEASGSAKALDQTMLQSLSTVEAETLAQIIARAGFAVRVAAAAGEE